MKAKELKQMAEADLSAKIAELQKQLMKDYAQVAMGTVPKNPGQIRLARRTLARIYTIQNERRNTAKHG